MKIKAFFALLLAGLLSMSAMAATFTDAEGREVAVENPQRVLRRRVDDRRRYAGRRARERL